MHKRIGENPNIQLWLAASKNMSKVDDTILLNENLQWNILKLVQPHISPYLEINVEWRFLWNISPFQIYILERDDSSLAFITIEFQTNQ
jgi:hypothetical protein